MLLPGPVVPGHPSGHQRPAASRRSGRPPRPTWPAAASSTVRALPGVAVGLLRDPRQRLPVGREPRGRPSPRSLSRNARSRRSTRSSALERLSTKTRQRERSAPFRLKLGFSVVAPIRVIVPRSTWGRKASCCALLNRWISSQKRIVPRPSRRRVLRLADDLPDPRHALGDRAEAHELAARVLGYQPGQRGLAGAGRAPEDGVAESPRRMASPNAHPGR